MAEVAVIVLIDMKCEGTKFLYLTEQQARARMEKKAQGATMKQIDDGGAEAGPVRVSYSKDEIIKCARTWMVKQYGAPNKSIDINRWHERFGFLVDFLTDHFGGRSDEG